MSCAGCGQAENHAEIRVFMISEKRLEIRHKISLCFLADICDFMEAQIAKWLERSRVSLAPSLSARAISVCGVEFFEAFEAHLRGFLI